MQGGSPTSGPKIGRSFCTPTVLGAFGLRSVGYSMMLLLRGAKMGWQPPTFARSAKHKLPDGRKITVKAGTQVIVRAWHWLKERLQINHSTMTGSHQLASKIKAAQHECRQRSGDMWASTVAPFSPGTWTA